MAKDKRMPKRLKRLMKQYADTGIVPRGLRRYYEKQVFRSGRDTLRSSADAEN